MEQKPVARSGTDTDRSAEFERLVGPWVTEMYRAAAAICGRETAEEVTQDALLDAWRGFDRLRDPARIRAWLHSVLANRARKHLRYDRFRPRVVSIENYRDGSQTSDPYASVAERDRLDRVFGRLSVDQRMCVVLHYALDMAVPEVAQVLGLREGTVKSRIHAAVLRLRAALLEDAP